MKQSIGKRRGAMLCAFLLVGGLATEASAELKTWIGGPGSGTWSNPANWSPTGVPAAADVVLLSQSDATNRVVHFVSGPAGNAAAQVTLSATGTGRMTFFQNGGTFSVPTFTLANSGRGEFTRIGGTANIGSLNVANNTSGVATVTLNGGTLNVTNTFNLGNNGTGIGWIDRGTLAAGQINIGNNGTGNFTHAQGTAFGATVSATRLRLGVGSQSIGVYETVGSGASVVNAGTIQVGINGSGFFRQNEGIVTCTNDLILGDGTSGAGTYDLNGGTLNVGGDLSMGGRGGDGTFNQSAHVAVADAVRIGNGGRFNSNLGRLNAGSVLLLPAGVFNGSSGTIDADSFVHSGGTVTGTLFIDRTSTTQPPANYIYNSGAFSGKLDLKHRSMLTLNADFTAGDGLSLSSGTFTLPAGRTLTLNGSGLAVSLAANVSLDSNLNATAAVLSGGALLEQRGLSQVMIGDASVGAFITAGAGTYLLSGAGAAVNFSQLFVGNATFANSIGHVIVAAGSLSTTGQTRIDRGDLMQSGGSATFATVLNQGAIQLSGGVTSVGDLDGTGSLTVSGTGSLTVNRIRQGQLIVTGTNPRVTIRPDGTDAATSRVGAIDLGAPGLSAITGTLDLADNDLVVDYTTASPLATVRQYIASGYNGGAWNGAGINPSMGSSSNFALGYAEASDIFTSFPATFSGQQVDDTTILVAFTRYGDANLDRVVNLSDFNALAANFGAGSGAVWTMGDFNYDGLVNLSDFNLLAANFGLSASGPDVTPQDWANLAAVVPEPALAPLWLWGLVRNRRGRRGAR